MNIEVGATVRLIGFNCDCKVIKLVDRFGIPCAVINAVGTRKQTVARIADLNID